MEKTQDQTFTRADLSIRPAQPADRPALEAIARQTWDGDDYLPRVLTNWFDDPHGGFFVALLRDQVIGAGKVTRFAEGEWWLEGLRIDPAYQGHGFARVLHHFLMNQSRWFGFICTSLDFLPEIIQCVNIFLKFSFGLALRARACTANNQ